MKIQDRRTHVAEIAADAIAFQRQLVRDEPRTRAFAEAIRATVKPGDVVLDLGCGTGILAMIARDAGARRVFAIEQSHLADVAAMLAAHNGREIEVLHGWSFELDLPERANVLITETLSNHGLNEGILRYVLDARRRMLTEEARVIPRRIVLTAAPVEVPPVHAGAIASWSDPVQQFDFSPLRGFASSFMYGIDADAQHFLAAPQQAFDIDLATIDSTALSIDLEFEAQRDGMLQGLAVWFAATLAGDIVITNAPPRGDSHWGQALMPIDPPIPVERGQVIKATLSSQDSIIWRWSGGSGLLRFDHSNALALTPCIAPDVESAR